MQQDKSNMSVEKFFSDYIKSDPDFSVFTELIDRVLSECKSDISRFPDLIDVDHCPEKFLPLLGYMVGYIYNPRLDCDLQRQVIKHVFRAYHIRGTKLAMENAGTYGDYDYWVGGDLFIPGAKKRAPASILLTNTRMFTHNKSKFSGIDKYPDEKIWRDGVVQITLPDVNETIISKVLETLPAGMKLYITIDVNMDGSGSGDPIGATFKDITVLEHVLIDIMKLIKDNDTYCECNIFSAKNTKRKRSGRQLNNEYYLLDIMKLVNFNAGVDNNPEFDNRPIYRGVPKRSVRAPRSGKYAQSGSFTGDHQIGVVSMTRTPLIISPLYVIDDVKDFFVGQLGLNYFEPTEIVPGPVEVEIIKR